MTRFDLVRWSEQNLAYLRAHAAEPLAALAQTLHRSPVAVKIKRSRLGLTSPAGSEAGRALAAQRQLVDLICAECSVAVSARRLPGDGPRYCSDRCRNRVKNRRRRAKVVGHSTVILPADPTPPAHPAD